MKRKGFLLSLFILVFAYGTQAQLLNQAKTWYLQKEYLKAIPVFRNEVRSRPKDPSLNMWYGACLYETGKVDESLPYLQFAVAKGIPDAELYLAKYLLNKAVPDSALIVINHYLSYPKLEFVRKDEALEVKKAIESSLGNLQKVEDICFIDSLILLKGVMYNNLKISPDAGTFVPARPTFPNTKSNGAAYLPQKNDRAYYGNLITGKGYDIVARHRLINDWDIEEPLSDIINSVSDEINPYFLSDGTTLYFASRRPGGLGGFDLYVTRQSKNGSYLLPDHLNMPFNSKDNDYFLIIDEFSNRGYLATDRNQPRGYVAIYTFIPNTTTVFVQDKSLKELRDLADIKSIKATQVDKNVDSLMRQPVKPVIMTQNNDHGVVFILNDELSCNRESDFQSEEAKAMYKTFCDESSRLNVGSILLNKMREQYLNSEPEDQARLTSDILKLESEVLSLKKSLPELEMQIRNKELTKRLK
jgi:tetratricopeptide (TPR) repeat protein